MSVSQTGVSDNFRWYKITFISIIKIYLQGHLLFVANYIGFPFMMMIKSFLYHIKLYNKNSLFKA